MRTLIIVPTHDEAENIGALLDGLDEHVPDADVLVIDDASADGTRQIVKERAAVDPRISMIERAEKRGLGDAYTHAFGVGLERGYDALVEIDADLSHDPAVLPTMLDLTRRGIALVIGSRYVPGGSVVGWPRRRTWLSRWGNRYAAIMLGLAVNDATAGFRVYRADTLRTIGLDGVQAGGKAGNGCRIRRPRGGAGLPQSAVRPVFHARPLAQCGGGSRRPCVGSRCGRRR